MWDASWIILFVYFACMMALYLEGCLRKNAERKRGNPGSYKNIFHSFHSIEYMDMMAAFLPFNTGAVYSRGDPNTIALVWSSVNADSAVLWYLQHCALCLVADLLTTANLFLALESGILPAHFFLSLHCLPLVTYVTFRSLMLSTAQPKKNFESECFHIS